MKQHLLEQMLLLTQQQTATLEKEEIELFEELSQKKQEIMNTIDILDQSEVPTIEEKQIYKKILTEIIRVDTNNRKKFDEIFQETKVELKKLRSQQKMENTYAHHYDRSMEEGMFIDKR